MLDIPDSWEYYATNCENLLQFSNKKSEILPLDSKLYSTVFSKSVDSKVSFESLETQDGSRRDLLKAQLIEQRNREGVNVVVLEDVNLENGADGRGAIIKIYYNITFVLFWDAL